MDYRKFLHSPVHRWAFTIIDQVKRILLRHWLTDDDYIDKWYHIDIREDTQYSTAKMMSVRIDLFKGTELIEYTQFSISRQNSL